MSHLARTLLNRKHARVATLHSDNHPTQPSGFCANLSSGAQTSALLCRAIVTDRRRATKLNQTPRARLFARLFDLPDPNTAGQPNQPTARRNEHRTNPLRFISLVGPADPTRVGLILGPGRPRGATVFKDLVADPPASEQEFIVLWKLYILGIDGRRSALAAGSHTHYPAGVSARLDCRRRRPRRQKDFAIAVVCRSARRNDQLHSSAAFYCVSIIAMQTVLRPG